MLSARARLTFTVSQQDMMTFARQSGDENPIHTDNVYSRKHGYKARVVYGGLIVRAVSGLLGMKLPGLGWIEHSLHIKYKSPLYENEKATLVAKTTYFNEDLGIMRLAIEVKRGKTLLAEVEVQCGKTKRVRLKPL